MLYKPVIIEHIREEIKGFKTFLFKEGHDIDYKAGQYITFAQKTTHEEIRRSYSIVSAPLLSEPLTIGVKRIENGLFSRELIDHAKPGDELFSSGAGGLFTLPDDLSNLQQIFFLAAGSGITPVYSLLKTVLHLHKQINVVLIYSNPEPGKTIFLPELSALKQKFDQRFQLQFLFSNSVNLSLARLNRELLTHLMMKHSVCNFDQTLFYVCGPEAYMRMCTYTLQEHMVPMENIRKENFIIQQKQIPRSEAPDKNDHVATVHYGADTYVFDVQHPDSILMAAIRQNISLPYSCETGRCGNCVARCISGDVWLSYNEVLTEMDLKNGLILTCVGHPVGGDIILKINSS